MSRLFPLSSYPKDKHNPLMGRCRDWGDINFNIFLSHLENASLVTVGQESENQALLSYYLYDYNEDLNIISCKDCSRVLVEGDKYYLRHSEDDGFTFSRIWCFECEQKNFSEREAEYNKLYCKLFLPTQE